MLYLPMELIKRCGEDLAGLGTTAKTPVDFGKLWLPERAQKYFEDSERYLRFLMSPAFMSKDISGTEFEKDAEIINEVNSIFIEKAPQLVSVLGIDVRDLLKGNMDIHSEFRDLTVFPLVLDMWAHHKQVYKPDKDFAVALMNTEKLELTKDLLEHLPYSIFYLDISDLGLGDVHGIFVKVLVSENRACVIIYNLTNDLVYFSHYLQAVFDENGVTRFNKADIPEVKPYVLSAVKELSRGVQSDYNFNRRDTVGLVMQMLAYISSQKPQIEESPKTKNTYKPNKFGDVVKNKWSELQMFEVGYAYGSAFRRKLEKAKEELGDVNIEILTEKEEKKHHNSPKPHIRCAHWHRWRCGEGHKELTPPRWMEPTFVGFGGAVEEAPIAVVHKVSSKGDKK